MTEQADKITLTDAEWREFQNIPDQGYSHRSWVDAKITARVQQAEAERDDGHREASRLARLLDETESARDRAQQRSGVHRLRAEAAEAERDALAERLARVEALAADVESRRDEAWARYMKARGAASQALWQGAFDALAPTASALRAALAPQVSGNTPEN